MNKRTLVFVVAAGLVALVAAAFAYDCVRIAGQFRARVDLADQDLAKPEQRLMKLLEDSPTVTPEVQSAIAEYRGAKSWDARHDAYEKVVAAFRKTMEAKIDPTDTLSRKFMDDVAGAMNRRELAEAPYDEEAAAYRAYLSGARGTVAKWFLRGENGAE